jgi:hypothetical protein
MSEYQYYEFRAIERPLTTEEQNAVARLSSRVDPHPTRAVFVYNYSDFPGSPEDVLANYYDALFYITNWGSVQLAFRFPKALIDVEQIRPYCVEMYLTCNVVGEYVIINFERQDTGGDDWIEGNGMLARLLPLREAVLRQDYRVLYLAWLMATEDDYEVPEDTLEPPVPVGLGKLSTPLQEFVDAFGVDDDLITAAAEASPPLKQTASLDIQEAAVRLSADEQKAWLLRLANDELRLGVKFQRFLREKSPTGPVAAVSTRRTVAQLQQIAEEAWQKTVAQQKAAAAAKRKRKMEALAPEAEDMWTAVDQLIREGKAKPYDEAVQLLTKLHDLAVYQGTEAAYGDRLRRLRVTYARRSAMLRRLDRAGLS